MSNANSIMLRLAMAGVRKPCVSMNTSVVAARRGLNLNSRSYGSRSYSSRILPEAAIYRTASLGRNGRLVDFIDRSVATENPKPKVRSRKGKRKKRKKQQNPRQSPADHAQLKATSKTKPKLSISIPPRRDFNEEGRRILFGSRADNKLMPRCKSIVHEAQTKMLFSVRYDHETDGPGHKALFYVTLHTTMNDDALGELRSQGISIPSKFVNTGSDRSKVKAERLACIDLIDNLREYGLDLAEEIPDVANRIREREEAKFKLAVNQAQMILQAMGITRPSFDTVECGKAGFQSTVSFYCRGEPMCIVDHEGGRSKEEAEGKAILVATQPGGQLEEWLIKLGLKDRLDRVRQLIEESPVGHIGTLKIPQLSYEAFDKMDIALDGHEQRMDWHAKVKDEYEQESHRRNRSMSAEGTSQFRSLASRGQEDDEEMNRVFQTEEQRRLEKSEADPNGRQAEIKSIRDKLPIVAIREQLIDALRSSQCVVVSGGTGSGKSTQCPQYILEDAIANGKGAQTKIVVTQPRRIAAISVAERIASERDEEIGRSVGYNVRFNRRAPRGCGSIEFVTTGILLRRLVNDPTLRGVSHVCLDEVHERDIDTDFLLVLLRDLLKSRPDLRVILMSATLDADSFGRYFGNEGGNDVPVMSVPTKPRHPVETIHLEDLARESDETSSPVVTDREIEHLAKSLLELHDEQLHFDLEEALAEDAAAKRLDRKAVKRLDGPIIEDSDDSSSDEDTDGSDSDTDSDSDDEEERQSSRRVKALRRALSMRNASESSMRGRRRPTAKANKIESEITSNLMSKLAIHVARSEIDEGRQGSVLCFLPGLDEIKECMRLLEENTDPSLLEHIKIIPLHSSIPQSDQQKVFIPAGEGCVKVILATNIAESSVTINDVLAIVDSGLVKEMSYDSEKSLSKMLTVLCSKASATQRLGRAGRVAPGKCYRIYSRGQLSAMKDRPLPEIQRSSLDATCLNTSSMTQERVETFLQRAMDPPKEEAVAHSMTRLRKLGAISLNQSSNVETLSPLGVCLSKLPLDPAMGKMLIMGCVMNCLDPVLTAAACFSSNEVFYYPPDMRREVHSVRKEWSDESDLLASVNAYYAYQDFKNKNGWQETRLFSDYNFIGSAAIRSIHSVRSQLLDELTRIGLVPRSDLERTRDRLKTLRHDASVNANADSLSLFTALLSCGLPDNLASKRRGSYQSRVEGNAGIHPSSVLFQPYKSRFGKEKKNDEDRKRTPNWLLYQEMVITSQVFLRRCTALTPLQIVLFGGYKLDGCILDDWIAVNSSCEQTLHLLSVARKEINAALDLRVMNPKNKLPEENQEVLDAVCDTLFDDESFEQSGPYRN